MSRTSYSLLIIATMLTISCIGEAGSIGERGDTGSPGESGESGVDGRDGIDGIDGIDGTSCTASKNDIGTVTISCTDGSSVTIENTQDDVNILTRIVSIPDGDQCPSGGRRVEVGNDSNRNGQLDDDEVDSVVSEECFGEGAIDISGSITIENALDLVSLARIRSISGDLTVRALDITALSAPLLERIGGQLDVSFASNLQSISLNRVVQIGSIVTQRSNPLVVARSLHEIRLPFLQRVSSIRIGNVFDEETVPLSVLECPNLNTLDDLFIVNTQLREVSFSNLNSMSSAIFIAAKTIETINLGIISSVGEIL